MSQISYIRLDSEYEPVFTSQVGDLLTDVEATGQAILTRLKLLLGEWWEDQSDGLPLWQQILGQRARVEAINLIITQRIRDTPFVLDVFNVVSSFDSTSRAFSFTCSVNTQFGTITVSSTPSPPNLGV